MIVKFLMMCLVLDLRWSATEWMCELWSVLTKRALFLLWHHISTAGLRSHQRDMVVKKYKMWEKHYVNAFAIFVDINTKPLPLNLRLTCFYIFLHMKWPELRQRGEHRGMERTDNHGWRVNESKDSRLYLTPSAVCWGKRCSSAG